MEEKLTDQEEIELCLNCPLPKCMNCLNASRKTGLLVYKISVRNHFEKLKEKQEQEKGEANDSTRRY